MGDVCVCRPTLEYPHGPIRHIVTRRPAKAPPRVTFASNSKPAWTRKVGWSDIAQSGCGLPSDETVTCITNASPVARSSRTRTLPVSDTRASVNCGTRMALVRRLKKSRAPECAANSVGRVLPKCRRPCQTA